MSGNTTLIADPTINDTDPDSPYTTQLYTLTGLTLPSHGSLTATGNGLFEYTPMMGYIGNDSFQYQLMDQSG
jgi:Bacterial Ig domain